MQLFPSSVQRVLRAFFTRAKKLISGIALSKNYVMKDFFHLEIENFWGMYG